jgi:hypothetical protein
MEIHNPRITGSLLLSGSLVINGTSYDAATSGTSGAAGVIGTSGSGGTSGSSGTRGTAGSGGTSGSSGTMGTAGSGGTSGSSGTMGTAGSGGTSGANGANGTSGSGGTSGANGANGTSGSGGTSGANGANGTSGSGGTSGVNGVNGTSGVNGTTAGTSALVNRTLTGANADNLLYAAIADNDYFRLRVGGTATNAGFAEIATADDGNEPIYVRQYTGVFSSITRTATLLNESGNTSFPGTLSTGGALDVTGNVTIGTGGASSMYMRDSDEGQRELHCNSNRIGFLTQGGGWGSYCNDDGSWVSVSDITAFSDARIKENIVTIDDALEKVLKLRGVYYNRIDISDKSKKIGVIAQETKEVLPEVVHEEVGGMLGVAYGNMGGLFIEAFKEQQEQIERQQKEIDELKNLIKQLINK